MMFVDIKKSIATIIISLYFGIIFIINHTLSKTLKYIIRIYIGKDGFGVVLRNSYINDI